MDGESNSDVEDGNSNESAEQNAEQNVEPPLVNSISNESRYNSIPQNININGFIRTNDRLVIGNEELTEEDLKNLKNLLL